MRCWGTSWLTRPRAPALAPVPGPAALASSSELRVGDDAPGKLDHRWNAAPEPDEARVVDDDRRGHRLRRERIAQLGGSCQRYGPARSAPLHLRQLDFGHHERKLNPAHAVRLPESGSPA